MSEIQDVQAALRQFARERNWESYHTPRNLAALISSEAGELLALFRWDQDAIADNMEKVQAEIADVYLGILRFADVAGIDLTAVATEKIKENARRYPAEKVAGPDRP